MYSMTCFLSCLCSPYTQDFQGQWTAVYLFLISEEIFIKELPEIFHSKRVKEGQRSNLATSKSKHGGHNKHTGGKADMLHIK